MGRADAPQLANTIELMYQRLKPYQEEPRYIIYKETKPQHVKEWEAMRAMHFENEMNILRYKGQTQKVIRSYNRGNSQSIVAWEMGQPNSYKITVVKNA